MKDGLSKMPRFGCCMPSAFGRSLKKPQDIDKYVYTHIYSLVVILGCSMYTNEERQVRTSKQRKNKFLWKPSCTCGSMVEMRKLEAAMTNTAQRMPNFLYQPQFEHEKSTGTKLYPMQYLVRTNPQASSADDLWQASKRATRLSLSKNPEAST